jgi:phosphatidylserine decarboxylase
MIAFLFFKLWPLAIIFLLATALLLFFFRDPERKILARPGVLLSPADGKIVDIIKGESIQKISIFLSLLDVHIVRSPLEGLISSIERKTGKNLPAFKGQASKLNEAMTLTIKNQQEAIDLKMIVGVAARRLCCYVQPGDKVTAGMRLGLMAFGSRVELSFPANYALKIDLNQKVKGGLTILAEKEKGEKISG